MLRALEGPVAQPSTGCFAGTYPGACETRRTTRTEYPTDPDLVAALESFGVPPDAYLGHGGEAWVYALGHDRVLRVLHEGGTIEYVQRQRQLLEELARTPAAFELPQILEVTERSGRVVVIERRLRGSPGIRLLGDLDRKGRQSLIESHLEATAQLGDLALEPRPYFGELLHADPVRATSWRDYLEARAERGLLRAGDAAPKVRAKSLAGELDDVGDQHFVHLDSFLDNMLFTGTKVCAVLDVGVTAAVGDRRLDVVASVVYLSSPAHTPNTASQDADVARGWLRQYGLGDLLVPVRRWLAAYWAGADDPQLVSWCRRTLAG